MAMVCVMKMKFWVARLGAACNYDPTATENDGSCAQNDECGVCGEVALLKVHATVTSILDRWRVRRKRHC